MKSHRLLTLCGIVFLLSACAATPVLTGKGDLSREIKQKAPIVNRVAVSPNGRYALAGSFDTFVLWDILLGKKVGTFPHKGFLSPVAVAFSPDGRHFASGGIGTTLWDLATGRQVRSLDGEQAESLAFSPDGQYLLTGGPELNFKPFVRDKESRMKIYRVSTGELVRDFKLKIPQRIYSVAYSPDGTQVLSGDSAGQMKLWDIASGREVASVMATGGFVKVVRSLSFSPDGRFVLSGGNDKRIILWDRENLRRIREFSGKTGHDGALSGIQSVAFSPDGKVAVSGGADGKIILWDTATGKDLKTLSGHADWEYGTAVTFSPDGRRLVSAGDASTRIWDIATGDEVAVLIAFSDEEWIATTTAGYYNTSAKGDQYLQVKVRDRDYSVEQLRESFYRPELVQLALSGGSMEDLRKVGDVKPPPVLAIVDTPSRADRGEAAVTLKITDTGGGIGNIRLYLNGSAVLQDNARGVSIVGIPDQSEIRKSYLLKISPGINELRAIAFNGDNTMQSAPARIEITATYGAVAKPSLHALVIGIDEYRNPKLQLRHAVADAKLFADTLRGSASSLFEKVEITLLAAPEETTRERVLQAFQSFQALNPDDLFVLYVASHGTVDDGEYFLITSNVGSTRTERLRIDAIGQNLIKGLIGNIPSTKKLIVIDTCNAGALGDAIQVAMLTRGMSEDTAMKILSRAVGSTILSASTSLQEALEGYQGHGLFTYVLAEGLKGKADKGNTGYVRTTELADYVDNEVPALAEKVFNRAQYPTISLSGQAFPIGRVGPQ